MTFETPILYLTASDCSNVKSGAAAFIPNLALGELVPIPTEPLESMRMRSDQVITLFADPDATVDQEWPPAPC